MAETVAETVVPQVNPVPKEYHTMTPYLVVKEAQKALEWYSNNLPDCKELTRIEHNGKIAHAEMQIGNARFMLCDEVPGVMAAPGPNGSPVQLQAFVPNVDEVFAKAIAAGAKETQPLTDQLYGDRNASFTDPFGHSWSVSTHVRIMTPAEVAEAFRAAFSGPPAAALAEAKAP